MATPAEELERLAARARVARDVVEQHHAALGRYALVWWNGDAAERYWAHVAERRAVLAVLADRLGELTARASVLADAVRLEERSRGHPEAS